MIGKPILTLDALMAAVKNKRSVICPKGQNFPIPAAVMQNMQARVVYDFINLGLFVYKPKKER